MRQSVIRNAYGEIVKYNHSKWMTITGRWGHSTARLRGVPGVQQLGEPGLHLRRADAADHAATGTRGQYLAAFTKTWKQRTSRSPGSARVYSFGRMLPRRR